VIICSESTKLGRIGNFTEVAENTELIGEIKNIDEHNIRRNAENILQQKKTDDGLKMNILFKGLEERGKFIFKRKVEIIANVGKRHFLIKFRHDNSPFG